MHTGIVLSDLFGACQNDLSVFMLSRDRFSCLNALNPPLAVAVLLALAVVVQNMQNWKRTPLPQLQLLRLLHSIHSAFRARQIHFLIHFHPHLYLRIPPRILPPINGRFVTRWLASPRLLQFPLTFTRHDRFALFCLRCVAMCWFCVRLR